MELESIKNSIQSEVKKRDYTDDVLIKHYYSQYFQNLTSKELDKNFNKDILSLTKALSKLPKEERSTLIKALSRIVEFYVESKVEKEIDLSFSKLFKF